MLLTWLLVGVAAVRATPTPGAEHAPTPPTEHVPSSSVQDDHKYYKLSVYQNNAIKTFDENFIDMEAAEIKAGEIIFQHQNSIWPVCFKTLPFTIKICVGNQCHIVTAYISWVLHNS